MQVTNELFPTTAEQRLSFTEPGPGGPVVMVNLLRFRDKATYADGSDAELSGREAFACYQRVTERLIAARRPRPVYRRREPAQCGSGRRAVGRDLSS